MEASPDIPPSAGEGAAGNTLQMDHEALDNQIDELQQRLVALNADCSPSKSSDTSFETAHEQLSPKPPSANALGKRKAQDSPIRPPNPASFPPLRSSSRRPSATTAHSTTRPPTSHLASTRPSTARQSTAPSSQIPSSSSSSRRDAPTRTSAPSSRKSSFKAHPPPARSAPTTTTTTTATTSNNSIGRRRGNPPAWPPSPIIIHDRNQVHRSLRAFSDLRTDVFASMRAEEQNLLFLRSSSLPYPATDSSSLPHPAHASSTTTTAAPTHDSSTSTAPTHDPTTTTPEYSNHVPASNIDWTSPSTRRLEYAKIDRARSGVRGVMRRVTPRVFLRKGGGRRGFYRRSGDGDGDGDGDGGKGSEDEGKGSEAGTVRRFRMDVRDDDDEDEDEDEDGGVDDDEGGDAKGAWWKFGRKKRGGKGDGTEGKGGLSSAAGEGREGIE